MSGKYIVLSGCLLLLFLQNVNSANILGAFYFPSQSHHILGSTLLKELARRGHNVTMISPFPFKEKIANYTDIELKGLLEYKDKIMSQNMNNPSVSLIVMLKQMFTMIPTFGKLILQQEAFQGFLKSDSKFDVIILFHPFSETLFGLSHRFNAPIILFSPIGTTSFLNHVTGNISPYSYVPATGTTFTENMTFFQRVQNVLMGLGLEVLYNCLFYSQQQQLYEEYFPDAPPLEKMVDRVALALVNSHFSTESPKPYTPNMIQIGGFHVQNSDPLPEDLQKYLDDAKEGVVYFSFGSNIQPSKLEKEKLDAIIKSLSKIKQKVLWKFDADLPNKPKNVRLEKWLPQKGVLNHPNVIAFLTHGGKGSIVEATKARVPMVAIPFFGDQPKNVVDAVNEKYAVSVDLKDLSEETLTKALEEVLTNPMYKQNIDIKGSLLDAQPVNPMDVAVYWVDHVIKHKGADHLKPSSLKLNMFQQLLLDVIAFIAFVLLALIFVIYFLIKLTCKLCRRKKHGDKLKQS